VQNLRRHHIDTVSQNRHESFAQLVRGEDVTVHPKVDENVDVAVRRVLPAGDGAEDAWVAKAHQLDCPEDVRAAAAE
jgi:hypothetical protein